MPETLVIRLPEDPAQTVQCILIDGMGAPVSAATRAGLEDAAELSAGRRVIGLAPASHVLRTRADIPLKNKARIRQALPFALEEQLAADLDGQHFAFANRDDDGQIPVAVVADDQVQQWLRQLITAGIKPDALFAESDGLATVPSTVSILVDNERIIIRDADGAATVADPDSLQSILELMLDDSVAAQNESVDAGISSDAAETSSTTNDSAPINILVYCREQDYERFAVLWDMLRLRVDSLDVKILPDGALPRLASQIATSGGVNLLQGGYAPKRELPVQWREWQLPGLLLIAVLLLSLVQSGIGIWQLSNEEQTLDAAAAQLLSTTFPGAANVSDPWQALRSRLGNIESTDETPGPGFAEALEALATAFTTTPDIELEALSFRDGVLDLQLVAPSVERLDMLRQGIASAGAFSAEIQSANPDGDTIKGRLKIVPIGADS